MLGAFLQRYIKGARSERELLGKFHEQGYSVLRSAGSGVSSLGPDIIAIKDGVCLSFECKAWDRGSLSLDPESFDKLLRWERNTASHTFVAWRIRKMGWLFIKTGEFSKAERNYNVTMRRAMEINRGIDQVLALGLGRDNMQGRHGADATEEGSAGGGIAAPSVLPVS